jgi:hypothetical protein
MGRVDDPTVCWCCGCRRDPETGKTDRKRIAEPCLYYDSRIERCSTRDLLARAYYGVCEARCLT